MFIYTHNITYPFLANPLWRKQRESRETPKTKITTAYQHSIVTGSRNVATTKYIEKANTTTETTIGTWNS